MSLYHNNGESDPCVNTTLTVVEEFQVDKGVVKEIQVDEDLVY